VFRDWPVELPPELEVCAALLPGREDRWWEPPFHDIAPLVQGLAEALRAYQDLPFVFFGHSMGALIAFELARELRRAQLYGPAHLFVSGARAPHRPDGEPPIHGMPEPLFLEKVLRYQGIPAEVQQNPELMKLVLPTIRADFCICETYSYSSDYLLQCPISAFGGGQDPRISRDDVAAWRHETQGTFRLRIFPGNHFFINPHRRPLLGAILQDLSPLLRYLESSVAQQ